MYLNGFPYRSSFTHFYNLGWISQRLLKGSGTQPNLILESGVMQYSSDGLSILGSHFSDPLTELYISNKMEHISY